MLTEAIESRDDSIKKIRITFLIENVSKNETSGITTSQPRVKGIASPATKHDIAFHFCSAPYQIGQTTASINYILSPIDQIKPLQTTTFLETATTTRSLQTLVVISGLKTTSVFGILLILLLAERLRY
jgi:hypothetical protein